MRLARFDGFFSRAINGKLLAENERKTGAIIGKKQRTNSALRISNRKDNEGNIYLTHSSNIEVYLLQTIKQESVKSLKHGFAERNQLPIFPPSY